jgi:hypothetical protein
MSECDGEISQRPRLTRAVEPLEKKRTVKYEVLRAPVSSSPSGSDIAWIGTASFRPLVSQ